MRSILLLVLCITFLALIQAKPQGSLHPLARFASLKAQGCPGVCQPDTKACSGSYHPGLCPGAANVQCCIPSAPSGGQSCGNGGRCQANSEHCAGSYKAGLCPGAANVECCEPSSSPAPSPAPTPAPKPGGGGSSSGACHINGLSGKCQGSCGQTQTTVHNLCPGSSICCIDIPDLPYNGCRTNAIARARQWVDVNLQYCQTCNGCSDSIDRSCSPVCNRASNSIWNPYRSDCSGLASWSHGIGAPGLTTYGFYPFSSAVSTGISYTELKPGDAVNNADHVMVFLSWNTKYSVATFLEEPGCSASPPHAKQTTTSLSVDTRNNLLNIPGHSLPFHPIRFNSIKEC